MSVRAGKPFITILPPGKYQFVVSASNGDNLWNEAGDTLRFDIPPAYYQTYWFRSLGVILCLAGAIRALPTTDAAVGSPIHPAYGRACQRTNANRARISTTLCSKISTDCCSAFRGPTITCRRDRKKRVKRLGWRSIEVRRRLRRPATRFRSYARRHRWATNCRARSQRCPKNCESLKRKDCLRP